MRGGDIWRKIEMEESHIFFTEAIARETTELEPGLEARQMPPESKANEQGQKEGRRVGCPTCEYAVWGDESREVIGNIWATSAFQCL